MNNEQPISPDSSPLTDQPAASAPEQVQPAAQAASPRIHLQVLRQWGQLFGTNIRTLDTNGQLICFSQAKAFKLKEDIAFYRDEAKTSELFRVKARNVIDISAIYDMFDVNGQVFGSLRRKGLASAFVRDEWLILDATGKEVGSVVEDSNLLGVLRRWVDYVAFFIPQKYHVTYQGKEIATIQQRKNPLTVKYDYDIDASAWQQSGMLLLAISSLLALIEARQN